MTAIHAQAEQLEQLASIEAQTPFDLSQGPLLRVKLYQIAPKDHVLLITLHHIITDGWSMGIFCRELSLFYAAALEQKPHGLPPLTIQYADFAYGQRQWLQGETLEQQLDYWRQQLADLTPLQLPLDYPRPTMQTYDGQTLSVRISTELSQQLKQLSQKANVTLFTSLFSAFSLLLGRYSGQEDIAIGTPIAGRTNWKSEELIGYFINTLVLRSDLSGQPDFYTLLKRNHQMTLAAYDHQDTPFEKVVDALVEERDTSRSPLFQVMFVLQNMAKLPGVCHKLK